MPAPRHRRHDSDVAEEQKRAVSACWGSIDTGCRSILPPVPQRVSWSVDQGRPTAKPEWSLQKCCLRWPRTAPRWASFLAPKEPVFWRIAAAIAHAIDHPDGVATAIERGSGGVR